MKIHSIEVKRLVDTDPDTSTIGEYTDTPDDWAIVREGDHAGTYIKNLPEDARLQRGRNYRFFKPYAGGEAPGTPDYQKNGLQDWERMEGLNRGDWHFVGVRAKLQYTIAKHGILQTLESCGLWGIESDSGNDYFREVAEEELDALKTEAKGIGLRWSKKMATEAIEEMVTA